MLETTLKWFYSTETNHQRRRRERRQLVFASLLFSRRRRRLEEREAVLFLLPRRVQKKKKLFLHFFFPYLIRFSLPLSLARRPPPCRAKSGPVGPCCRSERLPRCSKRGSRSRKGSRQGPQLLSFCLAEKNEEERRLNLPFDSPPLSFTQHQAFLTIVEVILVCFFGALLAHIVSSRNGCIFFLKPKEGEISKRAKHGGETETKRKEEKQRAFLKGSVAPSLPLSFRFNLYLVGSEKDNRGAPCEEASEKESNKEVS